MVRDSRVRIVKRVGGLHVEKLRLTLFVGFRRLSLLRVSAFTSYRRPVQFQYLWQSQLSSDWRRVFGSKYAILCGRKCAPLALRGTPRWYHLC